MKIKIECDCGNTYTIDKDTDNSTILMKSKFDVYATLYEIICIECPCGRKLEIEP